MAEMQSVHHAAEAVSAPGIITGTFTTYFWGPLHARNRFCVGSVNLGVATSQKHYAHAGRPLMAVTEENVAAVDKVREDP